MERNNKQQTRDRENHNKNGRQNQEKDRNAKKL